MRFKQCNPNKVAVKYRCYSATALTNAYQAVREENMSVRRASIQFNVPMQTLRDRVLHKVDPKTVRSGPQPLFSEGEEALFVNNLKYMASLGYGYTGPEVIAKASNYAVHLRKRSKDQPLSEKWYSRLKSRWPELKTLSLRALAKERAQATSEHVVNHTLKIFTLYFWPMIFLTNQNAYTTLTRRESKLNIVRRRLLQKVYMQYQRSLHQDLQLLLS